MGGGGDDDNGEGNQVPLETLLPGAIDDDEDDVDMGREDGGDGGAGSSRGRPTAGEAGVDVGAAVERAARVTSAIPPRPFAGELVGVKKKDRGNKKGGARRRREKAGRTTGVDGRDAAVGGFTPDIHSHGDSSRATWASR